MIVERSTVSAAVASSGTRLDAVSPEEEDTECAGWLQVRQKLDWMDVTLYRPPVRCSAPAETAYWCMMRRYTCVGGASVGEGLILSQIRVQLP